MGDRWSGDGEFSCRHVEFEVHEPPKWRGYWMCRPGLQRGAGDWRIKLGVYDIYVITVPWEWVRLSRARMSNERRRWFRT